MQKLCLDGFTALPHLPSSALMRHHQQMLTFDERRPTVLVGPNGAGKSAVLQALALKTLSYYTGESCLDSNFTKSTESDAWWTNESRWGHDYVYLKGLLCDTDQVPALYYRPGHIPGNESMVVSAMMTGYDVQARAYARAVEHKSSGQAAGNLLQRVLHVLAHGRAPQELGQVNWHYGTAPKKLERGQHTMPWEYKAEVLKTLVDPKSPAPTLVLMDEPEQSLDARAQLKLWQAIEASDPRKTQVVVATHSLYPLLHPERFHIVESEPGYVQAVRAALS